MRRKYLIGGVAAAALLVGGGFGVDAAYGSGGGAYGSGGGQTNGGQTGSPYGAGPMPGSATPSTSGLGTATLKPGTALVDSTGRALYLFEADSSTMSNCNGPCAQIWPPLLQHGAPVAASGVVQQGLLGSITRVDGTRQVSYDGHPLYYYAGDTNKGDATGQGLNQFGGHWYVVAPDGNKIDSQG
jgi:predicted lipoprotein with Yx(FWY)xxD motif